MTKEEKTLIITILMTYLKNSKEYQEFKEIERLIDRLSKEL